MEKKYYDPKKVHASPVEVPSSTARGFHDAAGYLPAAGLIDAANVAIILGQPLLLTGEPGTGKTRFAHHLAHTLGWGKPLVFEAKSTSAARDIFYTYDHLNDFRDAHRNQPHQPDRYLTFNALGKAILLTKTPDDHDVQKFWPGLHGEPGTGEAFTGPVRTVVLLDEIDKAPRDVPNDILNELELMYFKLAECGNRRIAAHENLRPIVILTSNSEKQLPDPFLRRCVFFDIPFPNADELARIVLARIPEFQPDHLLTRQAVRFFEQLRNQSRLRKKPGTAELLSWMSVLRAYDVPVTASLDQHIDVVEKSLGALVKTREDQQWVRDQLRTWLHEMSREPAGG